MRTLYQLLWLSLAVISSWLPPLYAQTNMAAFEHLSTAQGLSHNNVKCILQDSQGFLWFGTQDGLNRYDGYTFKVYKHDQADSAWLSGNVFFALCEDRTGNGLNYFDTRIKISHR